MVGEGFVEFDEVEAVVLADVLDDRAGDRPGARTDFAESNWWSVGRWFS